MALVTAVVGAVMLTGAVVAVATSDGGFHWIFAVWLAVGVAIVSFNVWAAFAPNGHLQTMTSDDDDPPRRLGMRFERDRS